MKVGYGRVSTEKDSQRFDRQEDQLTAFGCERIYLERVSGTAKHKPELERMLSELTEGDEVVCVSLDRLGRSTQQVLSLVSQLDEMGVGLTSLKEGFAANTPQGRFFLTIVAAFSELEVEMCRSRVRDGLESAKRRGKTLGRPRKDMDTAVKMWLSKEYSVSEICTAVGCCKQTLYNEIRRKGVSRD
ncbi:recombinase family protein [Adlercreutzia sp. ZJ242]|uniref:recombinase family protein n=1 Tax=Adlercreutzia sp. ZJ242 TaxID=2709409 RepID=UPI0013EE2059|nr:recombinase family protein [Adlercreutzia sp. ZJ242]